MALPLPSYSRSSLPAICRTMPCCLPFLSRRICMFFLQEFSCSCFGRERQVEYTVEILLLANCKLLILRNMLARSGSAAIARAEHSSPTSTLEEKQVGSELAMYC